MKNGFKDKKSPHKLPPSQRKPPRCLPAPAGCVEVWQVVGFNKLRPAYQSKIYESRDAAFAEADALWAKTDGGIQVESKAAIVIDGKYHIVYKLPIKFVDRVLVPTPKSMQHNPQDTFTASEQMG